VDCVQHAAADGSRTNCVKRSTLCCAAIYGQCKGHLRHTDVMLCHAAMSTPLQLLCQHHTLEPQWGVTHWRCVQADLWEAARAVGDGAFLVRKHVAAAPTRALHHVTFCRAAGTHSSVTLSLEQLLLPHCAGDMLFCVLLPPSLHKSACTLRVGHVSVKWLNAACACCQLAGSHLRLVCLGGTWSSSAGPSPHRPAAKQCCSAGWLQSC
jgi:hypothetical protein